MIDIGLNLTEKHFYGKEAELLERAVEAGINQMILTGSNLESSEKSLEFVRKYPSILKSTAGVHPHDAKTYTAETTERLKQLLAQEEVVAIGECGLDFDRNYSTPKDQFFAFESQLQLASDLHKPLFLHERAAHEDFLAVMRNFPGLAERSVVHCFTGNQVQLKSYLNAGFHIGVTGWVCDPKRGGDLRDALSYMDLDRLMIETDSPYLIPKNMKPKPKSSTNEPRYLPHIAHEIARIMEVDEAVFIQKVTENTKAFFKI